MNRNNCEHPYVSLDFFCKKRFSEEKLLLQRQKIPGTLSLIKNFSEKQNF